MAFDFMLQALEGDKSTLNEICYYWSINLEMWISWPITFSSFSIQNLVRSNCIRPNHLLNICLLAQLHSKNCLHFLKAKLLYMCSAMMSLHLHFCLLYNQLKHHHILAFFFVEESKTDLQWRNVAAEGFTR